MPPGKKDSRLLELAGGEPLHVMMKLETPGVDRDAAESSRASTCDHPADHVLEALCPDCGHPVDAVCPTCGGNVEASGCTSVDGAALSSLTPAEFYRRFVMLISGARNAKFLLGCYLIATGDAGAEGISMTEFGEHWGVGKAAVSKQCGLICEFLGIEPGRGMRKEATRRKLALSNRRPRKATTDGHR
jgi:hypothetical protein